ncbi:MAG: hypothetical protein JSS21_00615, partial [Proteobacteria bacterium]|nr:hypothetical protein [Pseudomonadota bacterium]
MMQLRCIVSSVSLLALCGGTAARADALADPPITANDLSQQVSAKKEEPQTLGTIYVTGTHIRGIDQETRHPLLVLNREDLLRTGLSDVAEIVQN